MDDAHLGRGPRDVADRRDEILRRHFAGQQHDAVVARHVDVYAVAIAGADVVGDLELDRLVVGLRADRAAIGRNERGAADRAGRRRSGTQPAAAPSGRSTPANTANSRCFMLRLPVAWRR